jgi:phosphatidylcholine synthase
VEFIHPVRVQRLRPLTLAMTFLWGALAIWAVVDDLNPGPAVLAALAVTSIYLGGIGAFLQYTRNRALALTMRTSEGAERPDGLD